MSKSMTVLKRTLNIDNMPEYSFHENMMNDRCARTPDGDYPNKPNRSGKRHANQPAEIAKRMKYSFKGMITDEGLIANYNQSAQTSRIGFKPEIASKTWHVNQDSQLENDIHALSPFAAVEDSDRRIAVESLFMLFCARVAT